MELKTGENETKYFSTLHVDSDVEAPLPAVRHTKKVLRLWHTLTSTNARFAADRLATYD